MHQISAIYFYKQQIDYIPEMEDYLTKFIEYTTLMMETINTINFSKWRKVYLTIFSVPFNDQYLRKF